MFSTSASCLTPDNSNSDNDNNSDNDDNSDDSSISSTPALDVYEQFKNKPIQKVHEYFNTRRDDNKKAENEERAKITADYTPEEVRQLNSDISAKYQDKSKALGDREEVVGELIERYEQEGGSEDEGGSQEAEAKRSEDSTSNKRKAAESDDTPPSETKRFKQDSSDISGDTEPYDFTGGDN